MLWNVSWIYAVLKTNRRQATIHSPASASIQCTQCFTRRTHIVQSEAQARQCGGYQECTVHMGETMTERGGGSSAALPLYSHELDSFAFLFKRSSATFNWSSDALLLYSVLKTTATLLLYISNTYQWFQLHSKDYWQCILANMHYWRTGHSDSWLFWKLIPHSLVILTICWLHSPAHCVIKYNQVWTTLLWHLGILTRKLNVWVPYIPEKYLLITEKGHFLKKFCSASQKEIIFNVEMCTSIKTKVWVCRPEVGYSLRQRGTAVRFILLNNQPCVSENH